MKRIFTIIFLVLTVLSLLAALVWCGYCMLDYQKLQTAAGVSGIDFLMTGTVYGIGLAGICIVGAISALVHCRLTSSKKWQVFDYVAVVALLLGMMAAFLLIFI